MPDQPLRERERAHLGVKLQRQRVVGDREPPPRALGPKKRLNLLDHRVDDPELGMGALKRASMEDKSKAEEEFHQPFQIAGILL